MDILGEFTLVVVNVGFGVFSAAWLGLFPFTLLPDIAWGVVVMLFVISAAAHKRHDTQHHLG